MTSDEERTLADLLKKKLEEGAGNVIRLLPGGRQDDTPLVQKLRDLLKQAEEGRFEEFVFIAVPVFLGNPENAIVAWSGSLSFRMLGALAKGVVVLQKS